MQRRSFITGLVASLAAVVAPLGAHENFRIVGTVTLIKGQDFDVKTKEGRTVKMSIDSNTRVTRDKKKVPIDELKVGLSVVCNARGDTIDDLMVLDIQIVPPLTRR